MFIVRSVGVISRKALRVFWDKHPDSKAPLEHWYKLVKGARWRNLPDVRMTFPHADQVGECAVFNIKGRDYRLITWIVCRMQRVYIRYVLTHAEYNREGWKMTAVVSTKVDAKKYGRLLSRALPSAIKTDSEYERMLAEVWKLMRKGADNLSAEEMALLELISVLIENYEEEQYPISDAAPQDVLRTLMQEHGLRQKDLVHIFRSSGTVSEVLRGKRQISKAQAKALAEFFHVSPEVFI